jgi:hypothetical protein
VDDWDKQAVLNNHAKCKEYIQLMYRKSAEYGILAGVVGAPWPSISAKTHELEYAFISLSPPMK